MIQSSMSPEQKLARYGYDPEPWLCANYGGRFAEPNYLLTTLAWIQDPRVSCIPTRDPLPFVNPTVPRGEVAPEGFRYSYPVNFEFGGGRSYFAPRSQPELRRLGIGVVSDAVTNPILSAFREYGNQDPNLWLPDNREDFFETSSEFATDAEWVFARTVLGRLARITEIVKENN